MKKTLFASLLTALMLPICSWSMNDKLADLCSTTWQGTYYYPKATKQPPVDFTAAFTCENEEITGKITEANTFGNSSTSKLYSDIDKITLDGKKLRFIKTYNGKGGVKHSVLYSGDLLSSEYISGEWKIHQDDGSDFSGIFEMHR
jgi:hypothetical protein